MRLSIIIPIYNVEPYVERCLLSLEDQNISRSEYEIICINDGSPDNSREVVLRLMKQFDNIVLIEQTNKGVSAARNCGLDRATGDYLLFIDPDDYAEQNSFSRVLKAVEEQKAQVSFLGFSILDESGIICKRILYEDLGLKVYQGIEAYFLSRGDGSTDPDRMWAVLFEREFIEKNKLRFLRDVPYLEDGEFIARILCLAKRCVFEGHSFYCRTKRPGSATNTDLFKKQRATEGFLLAVVNLKDFQKEQSLDTKQKIFLNQPIAKFVLLAINSSIGWNIGLKRLSITVRTLNKLECRKIELEGCQRVFVLYGKAYNASPYLGAVALALYPRINRILEFIKCRKLF